MIRRATEFESEDELITAEQAVAMARELKKLADAAADGHVLTVVEAAALERGDALPGIDSRTRSTPRRPAWRKKGARMDLILRLAAADPSGGASKPPAT